MKIRCMAMVAAFAVGAAWADGDAVSVAVGLVNDNLPCPYGAAVDGWSVGPDDQYTYTMTGRFAYGPWFGMVDDLVVTSRAEGWRFDVLRVAAGREFARDALRVRVRAGVALVGNYGGGFFQNALHAGVIGYPTVDFPYVERGFAANVGCGIGYAIPDLPLEGLSLEPFVDLDAYVGFGPCQARVGLDGAFESGWFRIEACAGVGFHAFLPDRLDYLLEDGPFAALLATVGPPDGLRFAFGAGLFPVGSVADDPAFRAKDYRATPQFYYLFAYGAAPGLRSFIAP